VEYALLLAAVLVLVLAGAAMLGSSVDRALAKISGESSGPRHHELREGDIHGPDDLRDSSEQPGGGRALLRLLVVGLTLSVALGLAAAGWSMKRRGAKKPEEQELRLPEPRAEERILWTRLNMKRDLIWKQLLADNNLMLENRIEVRHVMTCDPIFISKSTPGKRIAELLSKQRVMHLAVCDSDKRLLGVIRAIDHQACPDACAEEAMTPPQACVSPTTGLGAAISLLIEHGVSFLPVVDEGQLCGVLTPTDLVLTLHCSLQVWFRIAQSMQTNAGCVQDLEATNSSITEIADRLSRRVRRLPEQVKTAIATGNVEDLGAKLDETMATVSRMMQQLEDARAKIRQFSDQIAELKGAPSDEATGAASGEDLHHDLGRMLAAAAEARQPLSVILCVVDDYRSLQRDAGQEAANEHLRTTVQCVADHLEQSDYVCRYREDTLAIVLSGTSSAAACELSTRLSAAMPGAEGQGLPPRMSIVAARSGESAAEILRRAEGLLAPRRPEPELVGAAEE